MTVLTRSINLSVLLAATAMPALAAEAEREVSGNLAVWIFLGFCALIVIAQLLPLVWHISHKQAEHAAGQEPALEKVPKH